jgi:hypothetical protein
MPPELAAQIGEAQPASAPLPSIPPPLTYPRVTIVHNPFVQPPLPITGDGDAPDFVLPPNAGIASPPHVLAVVLGADPKALIDVDGRSVVAGIGTKLEGAAITSIDAHGVALENGERLPYDGERP